MVGCDGAGWLARGAGTSTRLSATVVGLARLRRTPRGCARQILHDSDDEIDQEWLLEVRGVCQVTCLLYREDAAHSGLDWDVSTTHSQARIESQDDWERASPPLRETTVQSIHPTGGAQLGDKMLGEFEDVTGEEKAFMKLWNRHILSDVVYADRHVPAACADFAVTWARQINARGLRHNLLLHLFNMWDQGLLAGPHIAECMKARTLVVCCGRRRRGIFVVVKMIGSGNVGCTSRHLIGVELLFTGQEANGGIGWRMREWP